MGFRFPARVHFDQMVLSDEAAEKSLLVQLADRDIISAETLQERFGEIPDIERIRINREHKTRENQRSPQKAGPYHNPQHRNDLEKIALQKDLIAPEDVGIVPCEGTGDHPFTKPEDRRNDEEIEKKKEEQEDKKFEREQKKFDNQQQQKFDPKGRPEDGRPKNSKDTKKRKQKVVKPRVAASADFINTSLWASEAQKKISNIVNPAILAHFDKKNLRSLTKEQMDQLEYIKLCVLCNIEPLTEIEAEAVQSILDSGLGVNSDILSSIKYLKQEFVSTNNREPTIEESRQIQASSYSLFRK